MATVTQTREMIEIRAGEFDMGSEDGQPEERPVHRVWVDGFAIAPVPVTNGAYARFVEASDHRPPMAWSEERFRAADQPVVGVSWFDAVAYCEWLSSSTGQHYRLPTEAEREKASRGGRDTRYPWGDDLPDWMAACGDSDRPPTVGQDPANGYGLHNTGDLVHEWCSDWYAADYYRTSPSRNPKGPEAGRRRASRGGSWRHRITVTRCTARSSIPPDRTYTDYGFRVARSAP